MSSGVMPNKRMDQDVFNSNLFISSQSLFQKINKALQMNFHVIVMVANPFWGKNPYDF